MGIERFAAVTFPSFYRNNYGQTTLTLIVLSFLFAAAATAIPAGISFFWPRPNVKYLCGRKAAFGTPFGIFDYAFNVIIISIALALNVGTYFKAMSIQQSRGSLRKIKCYTVVAVVSTVLISVPNLLSLLSATFLYVPHVFSTPAPIMECVNGALQFFINFAMNTEFRCRCFGVVSLGRYKRPNVVILSPLAS
uniref:G_PROTEIN_RECEP_F1_2 domain-containing protein n=1 Tax=Panagrellus redivivus TaxID=6233 RepID=A0A7E4UZT0_PANRE